MHCYMKTHTTKNRQCLFHAKFCSKQRALQCAKFSVIRFFLTSLNNLFLNFWGFSGAYLFIKIRTFFYLRVLTYYRYFIEIYSLLDILEATDFYIDFIVL